MIEFKKGDPEATLGKAAFYCRYDGDRGLLFNYLASKSMPTELAESDLLGMYLTFDEQDFRERTGASDEVISRQKETIEKSLEERGMPKDNPFYITGIPILSEEDLFFSDQDVIYAGSWKLPEFAFNSFNAASSIYILKHLEFLRLNKGGLEELIETEESPLNLEVPSERKYAEIAPDQLSSHIYSTYIVPMMLAVDHNETSSLKQLQARFREFGNQNNYFVSSVDAVCNLIPQYKSSVKEIQAHIGLVVAFTTEDYRAIPKLRETLGIKTNPSQQPKA